MRKIFFLFILIFLSGFLVSQPIMEHQMQIFAVTQDGQGTSAILKLKIMEGNGEIWSKVGSLVGMSTQQTEKTVIDLAKNYYEDVDKYDYKYDIISNAQKVDGPSAGLPMALLTISMLQGKKLPEYVSATGTISSTGEVGKVGGILAKTKEAAENNIKLFLIPKSELEVVVKEGKVKKVNLTEYAYNQWHIKVIGVDNIDEALEYAFFDLEDINIDSNSLKEELIYDPNPINYNPQLKSLHNFIVEYRDIAKKNLDDAKETLNKAKIQDNDVLNYLFETLTNTESFYEDGNIALDKNYLYSAANYFFLTNIYANFVKDIAQNPNMDITTEITILKKEISEQKKDLNYMPYDNYEWNIAAKERLLWAEKYITEINAVNVIVNGNNNQNVNFNKIEMYEFAKEWLKMSKIFEKYSTKNGKEINVIPYKTVAKQVLDELDKAQDIINNYQIKDVDRRIYGAKVAYENGWYLASIYESASALAIINSTVEIKDKDYSDIKELVKNKINNLKEIESKSYVWANLYLDHGKYLYNAALFYKKHNKQITALNNIKSAYQLLYLADNLAQSASDIENNKDALVIYKKVDSQNNQQIEQPIDILYYKKILLLLLLILVIAIIIIILLYKYYKNNSVYETALDFTNYQIYKVKELIIDLDKKFLKGKIDADTYKEMSERYQKELKELEKKKEKILDIMEDIEALESELKYLKSKLDSTTTLFKKGLISEKEYKKRITNYKKEISNVQYEIKEDEKKMVKTIERKQSRTKRKK